MLIDRPLPRDLNAIRLYILAFKVSILFNSSFSTKLKCKTSKDAAIYLEAFTTLSGGCNGRLPTAFNPVQGIDGRQFTLLRKPKREIHATDGVFLLTKTTP